MFSSIKSKLSIYTKLRLIVMRVLVMSFLLLFILLTVHNVYKSVQNKRDHIQLLAGIIAANVDSSLFLKDFVAAQQILDTLLLSASPIEHAILLDRNREIVASFGEKRINDNLIWRNIEHNQAVILGGDKVGELRIVVNLSRIWTSILVDLMVLAIALLGTLFLALFLVRDFAATIVEPIKKLAETSRIITKTAKYGLRTEKVSDDEIGQLTDTVNEMLDLIEIRDDDLRIAATAFNTQEAIIITDAEKNIIRVNPAYTKISGYQPTDVMGKNPLALTLSMQQQEKLSVIIDDDIAEKEFWTGELIGLHKNGYRYPAEYMIAVVKNSGNEITHYVMTFTDISERIAAEEEIRHLAFYDVLTRLPNRRLVIDRLKSALKSGERHHYYGALFFLDLDKFKLLNDSKGHHYGDMLLIEVAHRLSKIVRAEDTVARLGGDEFVVMVERLEQDEMLAMTEANTIGNKIVTALNQLYSLDGFKYNTSSSVGVTLFHGETDDIATLLSQADTAMYAAKNAGRNTLRFFGSELQEAIEKRIEDEQALRVALDKHQFELYYQVQVNNNGQAVAVEALIRWHHPFRGLVMPVDFIALAEEVQIIDKIGLWVIETACQQLAQWQQIETKKNLSLSINISVLQFQKDDFVSELLQIVKEHDINPKKLTLELTETVVLQDVDSAILKMEQLKMAGITISMDDFGTGYSSLNYISRLPVDQIKIDRSFVLRALESEHDKLIIKMVIALGKMLNINVVAEGIEHESQLTLLQAMECDYYQGFYFSSPMPILELELVLRNNYLSHMKIEGIDSFSDTIAIDMK